MLNTTTVSYVRLSDVLTYMGYPKLMEDAGDIFNDVTWGDSMHTLVMSEYVLNALYYHIDSGGFDDQTWTDNQAKVFSEKAAEIVAAYPLVDMES